MAADFSTRGIEMTLRPEGIMVDFGTVASPEDAMLRPIEAITFVRQRHHVRRRGALTAGASVMMFLRRVCCHYFPFPRKSATASLK